MLHCITMTMMTGEEEEGGDECARSMRKYTGTLGAELPVSVAKKMITRSAEKTHARMPN